MDISHWDAAIHYGIELAQYCDQTHLVTLFHEDCPLCIPLLEDSVTPKYLCGLMSP